MCVSGAAKPWAAKPWPTLARVSSTQRLAGEARAYETYQRSEGDELCERRGIGGGGGVVAAKLLGRRLRALQRHPRRSLSPRHMRAQFPPLRSTSAALPHTVVSAAVDPGDGQQGEVGTSLARVHSRGWTHTRGSLLRRRRVSGAGEPAREHHHRRGAKSASPRSRRAHARPAQMQGSSDAHLLHGRPSVSAARGRCPSNTFPFSQKAASRGRCAATA